MSATRGIALCPRCNRTLSTSNGRFGFHSTEPYGDEQCTLSRQHAPIIGDTPAAYVSRAHLVTDLAAQVQDCDPATVWEYLTALPAAELQRLTMIALAAVPIDQSVPEIFSWVTELPIARETA